MMSRHRNRFIPIVCLLQTASVNISFVVVSTKSHRKTHIELENKPVHLHVHAYASIFRFVSFLNFIEFFSRLTATATEIMCNKAEA